MERGYVKLWRKTLDGGMLGNQKLWAFWCWCLLKATHKQVKQIVGFQEIILEPGQFVFGRKKAAKELKMSEQSVRTIVLNLKNHEKLTIKTTSKYSVITIVNWELYQMDKAESTNISTNSQPTTNQQLTTNKNIRTKEHKKSTKNTLYSFALTGDRKFRVDEDFFKEKQKLYPGVDIMFQFGRMSEWLKNNPQRQKSSERGIKNFITNWLKKEQDRGVGAVKQKKPEFPKNVTCKFCGEKYRLAHHYSSCTKCEEHFYDIRADGTWKERYPDSDSKEIKQLTGKLEDELSIPQEPK